MVDDTDARTDTTATGTTARETSAPASSEQPPPPDDAAGIALFVVGLLGIGGLLFALWLVYYIVTMHRAMNG